jgi:hypothetical protein
MRELEDWETRIVVLPNGKTYDVLQELKKTEQKYKHTKQVYNLSSGRKVYDGKPVADRNPKTYTNQEAHWIHNHTIEEIAARWSITTTAADRIKRYVPFLHNLTDKPG